MVDGSWKATAYGAFPVEVGYQFSGVWAMASGVAGWRGDAMAFTDEQTALGINHGPLIPEPPISTPRIIIDGSSPSSVIGHAFVDAADQAFRLVIAGSARPLRFLLRDGPFQVLLYQQGYIARTLSEAIDNGAAV